MLVMMGKREFVGIVICRFSTRVSMMVWGGDWPTGGWAVWSWWIAGASHGGLWFGSRVMRVV
jgi:hypothetical protein